MNQNNEHPLLKIIQGLAEKDDSKDKIDFNDEAISKFIHDRNKPRLTEDQKKD